MALSGGDAAGIGIGGALAAPLLLPTLPFLAGPAGQLAGGLLGSQGGISSGDMILPQNDPTLSPGAMGSLNAALQLIGRGDIQSEPDPTQQLVGRIQGLSVDEKTKRRGLLELQQYMSGENLAYGGTFLDAVLARTGLTREGLDSTIARSKEFKASQQRLADAGYSGLQENTILNQLRAAQEAAAQLGAAAGFANSGTPQNALQESLLARDNKMMADLQDRLGVMANFGNINPGTMANSLIDAQLNQIPRLIEQALGVSQGLGGSVAQGAQTSGAAAGGQQQALTNAAAISAQQAQATNQLRNQTSLDNALSLANGVSGFGNSLQQGAFDAATLGILGKREGLI